MRLSDIEILIAQAGPPVVEAFSKLFSRFHWVSILSALLMAAGVWYYQRLKDPQHMRHGLFAYLFPKRIWLHRSALLDYRFVLFDKTFLGALIGVAALLLLPGNESVAAGAAAYDEVVKEVGEDFRQIPGIVIAFTLALLLTEDFLRYWAHRIMHASPLLWQFHKVHHSSEVLVPFSQLRNHPVNGLVNLIRSGLAIGTVTLIFQLLYPGQLNAITIFGINAGRFVFDALGAHLRHSHVWLSWGPILSRIVISPAQHQIHHSRARRHWDRNFASQFALWDWMFGTLYVPKKQERLAFGIGDRETRNLRTVRSLYLQPFRDAAQLLRGQRRAAWYTPGNMSRQKQAA